LSSAATSAYVLIAGGLCWILIGVIGLVRLPRDDRHEHRS
jgi:multisubunit Na+/H+ antiporter MnhG subunit